MNTSIKVQHSKHFQFDPAKQTIGAIELPETVVSTIVAGDEIINKKVPLDEAFTEAEQQELKKALEASVTKAHQRAATVPDAPVVATNTAAKPAVTAPATPPIEETGDSLF